MAKKKPKKKTTDKAEVYISVSYLVIEGAHRALQKRINELTDVEKGIAFWLARALDAADEELGEL